MSDQTMPPLAAADGSARPGPSRKLIERILLALGLIIYLPILAAAAWAFEAYAPDNVAFALAGHAFNVHNIHHRLFGDAALMFLILMTSIICMLMLGHERKLTY